MGWEMNFMRIAGMGKGKGGGHNGTEIFLFFLFLFLFFVPGKGIPRNIKY